MVRHPGSRVARMNTKIRRLRSRFIRGARCYLRAITTLRPASDVALHLFERERAALKRPPVRLLLRRLAEQLDQPGQADSGFVDAAACASPSEQRPILAVLGTNFQTNPQRLRFANAGYVHGHLVRAPLLGLRF